MNERANDGYVDQPEARQEDADSSRVPSRDRR